MVWYAFWDIPIALFTKQIKLVGKVKYLFFYYLSRLPYRLHKITWGPSQNQGTPRKKNVCPPNSY